jgi:hypothetical protein
MAGVILAPLQLVIIQDREGKTRYTAHSQVLPLSLFSTIYELLNRNMGAVKI